MRNGVSPPTDNKNNTKGVSQTTGKKMVGWGRDVAQPKDRFSGSNVGIGGEISTVCFWTQSGANILQKRGARDDGVLGIYRVPTSRHCKALDEGALQLAARRAAVSSAALVSSVSVTVVLRSYGVRTNRTFASGSSYPATRRNAGMPARAKLA